MSGQDYKQALPAGFRLGSYRAVRVLGAGGFGVTYLCEHAGLGLQAAVKEYLPNEIAVRDGTAVHPKSAGDREGFEWGLSRFLDEAKTLARFEHPNVVRVRDCFEANNTAYIVTDYEDGESLDRLLERHRTLTEGQLKRVVLPVADGLRQVHAAGFLHRDVKPANIFVRRSDESPVLLDFGSARQALGRRSRSVTAIASAGYSPPEQYESDGAQGAWTDIYALSALCYRAITGDAPIEAPRRQSQLLRMAADPLPRLVQSGIPGYSPAFLEAVDAGLRLIETERPQNVDDWLARVEGASTPDQRATQSLAGSRDRRSLGLGRGRSPPRPPETIVGQPLLSRMGKRAWSGIRGIFGTQTPAQPASMQGRLLGPMEYLGRLWKYLRRLVTGDLGLGKTFWLFGVAGVALLSFGLAMLADPYWLRGEVHSLAALAAIAPFFTAAGVTVGAPRGAEPWGIMLFLWSLPAKVGIWRAASTYTGPHGWAVLAKLQVSADALIAVVIILAHVL